MPTKKKVTSKKTSKKKMSSKKLSEKLEKNVLEMIQYKKIEMKPKWYFWLGSALMFVSVLGLSMAVIFLLSLQAFFLRKNGPFSDLRFQLILQSFPWWLPLLAIGGVILALWLMKKYDFSYQKNFGAIALAFVLTLMLAGVLLDKLGLNDFLSRGKFGRYYQRMEIRQDVRPGMGGGLNDGMRQGQQGKRLLLRQ